MTTGIEKKLISAADLAALPSGMGMRYELIDGKLIEMSPTGIKHGIVAARIIRHISEFVLDKGIGEVVSSETGFYIKRNPDTVRAPDVAFIPKERLPSEDTIDGYGDIVPALVVEVTSPNDTAAEIEDKTEMWLTFGVSQVWNVYPKGERILVHSSDKQVKLYQGDDSVPGGEILPGFELKLKDIFQ